MVEVATTVDDDDINDDFVTFDQFLFQTRHNFWCVFLGKSAFLNIVFAQSIFGI